MTVDRVQHREVEAGTQGRQREQGREKPPGADRDLGAGRGRQGGANGHMTQRQKQAHGVGRRDKRQRMAGGGCG